MQTKGEYTPDLLKAAEAMVRDYQTSEKHHPHHVLVTLEAFNSLRAALSKVTMMIGGEG